MGDPFHLRENGTDFRTEAIAGLTIFFSMAYIIIVNPSILSETGMEWGAVFIATLIAAIVGTLVMSLVANVPFAQAPGLGMSSFFTVTVCMTLGFTWQQALSMVFICGLINILITVTKVRGKIISAIPESIQYAISGGIGLFIAFMGLINVGMIGFDGVPQLGDLSDPTVLLFILGLVVVVILHMMKVRGSMIISMILITAISLILGLTSMDSSISLRESVEALPSTFGAIFTSEGIPSLFSDVNLIPAVLVTVMSFSLVDTFDTIGTFIATGRRSGIFSEEEMSEGGGDGFRSRMSRALLADSCATSIGAIVGTSNTTTVVESMTGVEAGGRTGLTSLVTSLCLMATLFMAPLISIIPTSATSAILVMVGILMMASFANIDWNDLEEVLPAFFAGFFMAICYNISYGIAFALFMYILVKLCKKEWRDIHPVMWAIVVLFLIDFVLLSIM